MKEYISIKELKKIQKDILKINEELDYLDPDKSLDIIEIKKKKEKLTFYITKLTLKPHLKLLK